MTKIYYHAYRLLKIFVLLDTGFDISPKIFFEKKNISRSLKTGACYMRQMLRNVGHPFLHFLVITEG